MNEQPPEIQQPLVGIEMPSLDEEEMLFYHSTNALNVPMTPPTPKVIEVPQSWLGYSHSQSSQSKSQSYSQSQSSDDAHHNSSSVNLLEGQRHSQDPTSSTIPSAQRSRAVDFLVRSTTTSVIDFGSARGGIAEGDEEAHSSPSNRSSTLKREPSSLCRPKYHEMFQFNYVLAPMDNETEDYTRDNPFAASPIVAHKGLGHGRGDPSHGFSMPALPVTGSSSPGGSIHPSKSGSGSEPNSQNGSASNSPDRRAQFRQSHGKAVSAPAGMINSHPIKVVDLHDVYTSDKASMVEEPHPKLLGYHDDDSIPIDHTNSHGSENDDDDEDYGIVYPTRRYELMTTTQMSVGSEAFAKLFREKHLQSKASQSPPPNHAQLGSPTASQVLLTMPSFEMVDDDEAVEVVNDVDELLLLNSQPPPPPPLKEENEILTSPGNGKGMPIHDTLRPPPIELLMMPVVNSDSRPPTGTKAMRKKPSDNNNNNGLISTRSGSSRGITPTATLSKTTPRNTTTSTPTHVTSSGYGQKTIKSTPKSTSSSAYNVSSNTNKNNVNSNKSMSTVLPPPPPGLVSSTSSLKPKPVWRNETKHDIENAEAISKSNKGKFRVERGFRLNTEPVTNNTTNHTNTANTTTTTGTPSKGKKPIVVIPPTALTPHQQRSQSRINLLQLQYIEEIDRYIRNRLNFYAPGYFYPISKLYEHVPPPKGLQGNTSNSNATGKGNNSSSNNNGIIQNLNDFIKFLKLYDNEFNISSNHKAVELWSLTPCKQENIRCYGYYHCVNKYCDTRWESDNSYSYEFQVCEKCNTQVYPFRQEVLPEDYGMNSHSGDGGGVSGVGETSVNGNGQGGSVHDDSMDGLVDGQVDDYTEDDHGSNSGKLGYSGEGGHSNGSLASWTGSTEPYYSHDGQYGDEMELSYDMYGYGD